MKKIGDILKTYYIICSNGEILPSLLIVLGISFFIYGDSFIAARKMKSLTINDGLLDAVVLSTEKSKVFEYRDGYKITVNFTFDGIKRTETIYTRLRAKRGAQVSLKYGFNKSGKISVICPELSTTYPPMFSLFKEEPVGISAMYLVGLFCCWHIFSTIKTGIKKVRLIKYGEMTNAAFVSKKKVYWIRRGSFRDVSKFFKVTYKYSVEYQDYTVSAETNDAENDFKKPGTKKVVYDPAHPERAMSSMRLQALSKASDVKQLFVGALCLAMSLLLFTILAFVTASY